MITDLIKQTSGRYTLEFNDDSMTGIGIYSGDTVVIDTNTPIKNGDIVVALINKEEATMKRYYLIGDTVELRPENNNLKTQCYPRSAIDLQGKLVGIFRQY
jgi:repressor LexA